MGRFCSRTPAKSPRITDRKCLLLNGFGMLLKEIVVELAIALRSSLKTEQSNSRLIRLR